MSTFHQDSIPILVFQQPLFVYSCSCFYYYQLWRLKCGTRKEVNLRLVSFIVGVCDSSSNPSGTGGWRDGEDLNRRLEVGLSKPTLLLAQGLVATRIVAPPLAPYHSTPTLTSFNTNTQKSLGESWLSSLSGIFKTVSISRRACLNWVCLPFQRDLWPQNPSRFNGNQRAPNKANKLSKN